MAIVNARPPSSGPGKMIARANTLMPKEGIACERAGVR